ATGTHRHLSKWIFRPLSALSCRGSVSVHRVSAPLRLAGNSARELEPIDRCEHFGIVSVDRRWDLHSRFPAPPNALALPNVLGAGPRLGATVLYWLRLGPDDGASWPDHSGHCPG